MAPTFTVCIYCGARDGRSPLYRKAAQHVDRVIGERGWRMVYGGGKAGLMGAVADAALAAGRRRDRARSWSARSGTAA